MPCKGAFPGAFILASLLVDVGHSRRRRTKVDIVSTSTCAWLKWWGRTTSADAQRCEHGRTLICTHRPVIVQQMIDQLTSRDEPAGWTQLCRIQQPWQPKICTNLFNSNSLSPTDPSLVHLQYHLHVFLNRKCTQFYSRLHTSTVVIG